jgi:hypothetical protein
MPIPRTELSCIQASDIRAASAENVNFVVIQTGVSILFLIGRKPIKRLTSIRLPATAAVPKAFALLKKPFGAIMAALMARPSGSERSTL